MASKVEYDQYAVNVAQRFEEFIKWTIENWPNKEFPLLQSDFSASRREIGEILGPKLDNGENTNAPPDRKEAGQYIAMNPMPWP